MDRRAATAVVATFLLGACGGGGGGGTDASATPAAAAGTAAPQLSGNIAAWGDSHTSGLPDRPDVPGFAVKLRALATGRQVFDGGVAGQTSTQIADRQVQDTAHDDWVTVLWYGGNNETQADRIKADLARSIASLAPGNDRFIVMAVVNSSAPWERRGTPDYQTIVQLDADLAAAYPQNFLDIRSFLVSQFDPNSAIDVADHADDIPPTSLRADGVHLNHAGYEAVARRVWAFIQAKGW
jgi:lysophospholipase L1-like esterase